MNNIWTYNELLPRMEERFKVTLGEGGTPLLRSKGIGTKLGFKHLYFKMETVNPTGSYKDRFAASAVSNLLKTKAPFCVATSSGNTGSALAAYCAAANIPCFLLIVDGVPPGKLQQMRLYGAKTIIIKDFGKSSAVTQEVFKSLNSFSAEYGGGVQISAYKYSPLGMTGVQTIAYEIAKEINEQNVHIFSPAGGGGLTLAMVKGFQKWRENHLDYKVPRVHCVQPIGNNTISGPLNEGLSKARKIDRSTTLISGLQVPEVIDGDEVISACRATGGHGYLVDDEMVFTCQRDLARIEGIYCEPAGAVGLAGLRIAIKGQSVSPGDKLVCLVTGHGFKDSHSTDIMASATPSLSFNDVKGAIEFLKSSI